jgi:hypothetical protein
MDSQRLGRILKDMQSREEPVKTPIRGVRNWIEEVHPWGVTLRSEEARVNPTRTFTWEEIEEGSHTHGVIKKSLRLLVGEE